MATLGFVGLGAMGSRMAKRLMDAGHTVIGYNRTREKAKSLVDAGMRLADSPRAAAEASEVVFSMVTDSSALHEVALGPDGIVAGLHPRATFVDVSTVSPAVIRELAKSVTARGASLLDAAISAGVVTLEQGEPSFMVGGDPQVLDRVRPYLSAIGPTITHVGEIGLAKTMKIAINLQLAPQILAFSEAALLAEKAGIARERAVEALLKSVLASPMLKYRGPFVLGQMPEKAWFNVTMMQKDLELALDLGQALGVPLPSVALAHEMLTAAKGMGLTEYDFAVVFDVLAKMSGLSPSPKEAQG